jgi:hypothetical protein
LRVLFRNNTHIRRTTYASTTSESSDFLIRHILTPDDGHIGRNMKCILKLKKLLNL